MCLTSFFFPCLFFYINFLIFSTLGRKILSYRGIFYTYVILLFVLFTILLSVLDDFFLFSSVTIFNFSLVNNNWLGLDINLSLKLDFLSFSFTLLVVVIGLATNFYISNYLKYEANEDIFALLINWFIFSMVFLVLANNLFSLFLGWESIGLSSFFLINFWSTRRGTVKSSFKAFFFNKISDVFLFIFLVVINSSLSVNDLGLINLKYSIITLNTQSLIFFALVGLIGCSLFKSAQLIGHLWLPDSMEAPVPASALIHSATLVSAGIYLLLRFGSIIIITKIQYFIMLLGSLTACYGGLVSASQTDMKKLLAYSTISHCGFLFVTIGCQVYTTCIIYLFMHGLFKASTFFCSGSFIRVSGSQDTRNMGNLSRILPVDTIILIICAFNLAGLPFSFGYIYKGSLLNSLLLNSNYYFIFGFCVLGLLSSIVYSFRLVYYSAFDVSKEFFPSIIYELQQKHINVVEFWSLTSIVEILSVSIILLFSVFIYVYFNNFFSFSELNICHSPVKFDVNSQSNILANLFCKSYFEIFYSSYMLLFFILNLVSWRVEYSFFFKVNLYSFHLNWIFFSIFFNYFFNMWGHILTEASTQQNFNFGFSTYKSEILVHLSQWQYWWWFWFSIWWTLYYFIIIRVMTKRTFNFNPLMNTSLRGRGKWGDFLVALIPVSWCCNILINSNFILRMIEWQNESSLFTIRIQGKQWYWVYKYDPNTAQSIANTPKNIGNNRWRVTSGQESYNADTYYQAINLASHIEFQDSYTKFIKKIDTHKKNLTKLSLGNEKLAYNSNLNFSNNFTLNANYIIDQIDENTITDKFIFDKKTKINENIELFSDNFFLSKVQNNNISPLSLNSFIYSDIFSGNSDFFYKTFSENSYSNYSSYYDFIQLDETSDSDSNSRHLLSSQPFRLIKGYLNNHVTDILQSKVNVGSLNKLIFFNTKFYQGGETLADKELMPETLWGFRQKKYKRTKKFKFKPEVIYDPVTFSVLGFKPSNTSPKIDLAGIDYYNSLISNKKSQDTTDVMFKDKDKNLNDNFNYRLSSKINRHRSELVPVTLARRLLRTKRTLVLPAHINLTLITNSYDVVHSWFVPGLGLKIDCVPGRSTHHTFYIDNIGFYYGQCAEICGRYHHHMPIRLCALPFEHFVVWWQSKGLARMNRTSEIKSNKYLQQNFNNNITREKLIYKMN